jgi:protein SCO1
MHAEANRTRRRLLLAAGLSLAGIGRAAAQAVSAHDGPVLPPVAVPDLPLVLHDGRRTGLRQLLQGRTTAVQLIFTGCTTTCPIQGVIFERVQAALKDHSERRQLLSLSIDPLGDTPAALAAWLGRFHARDGWLAAVPDAAALPDLEAVFGNGRDSLATHATEVQIVDRSARLIWRTGGLPSPQSVAQLLGAA